MADICPVCGDEVGFFSGTSAGGDVYVHGKCREQYNNKKIEEYRKTEKLKKSESSNQNEDIDEKQASTEINTSSTTSSNITNSKVQITNFDMPFEDMIKFMVKWGLASIPAFIILFIIFGILFAIFGALFF